MKKFIEGAVEDEIAWIITHVQFDDKEIGTKLTKGMKDDCRVNYEDESNRDFFEKYSISLNVNSGRTWTHKERKPMEIFLMLHQVMIRLPKTNPNEMNLHKIKKSNLKQKNGTFQRWYDVT